MLEDGVALQCCVGCFEKGDEGFAIEDLIFGCGGGGDLKEGGVEIDEFDQAERVRVDRPMGLWRHRLPEEIPADPPVDDLDQQWDTDVAERRREVLRALDALTPRQRAVVVLRWFEERGEGDVAHVLGCSVATAHAEGVEALGRLRDALPRADIGTGGLR